MAQHTEVLKLIQEITAKPVFKKALSHLKSSAELALRLEDRLEFALFLKDGEVCVEEREARADIEFSFNAEALRQLRGQSGEQLASFGIAVMELILAGDMSIRVRGGLWNLATGGYVQIIVAAGPELLGYLAQHGLSNTSKIINLMRSLKK